MYTSTGSIGVGVHGGMDAIGGGSDHDDDYYGCENVYFTIIKSEVWIINHCLR